MRKIYLILILMLSISLFSCSKKEAREEIEEAEKEINKELDIEIDNTGLEEDSIYEDSADRADPDIIDSGSEVIKEE